MRQPKSLQNRPGTARYPKGKERVEALLNTAKDILIKEGYGALTMRNIASQAGTTVGNLQYYYPNKDRLLGDLLEYMVHGFFESFESILADRNKSAEQKLIDYISSIFEAFPNEDKGKFYPELWALASHDANAASLMEAMYNRGFATLTSIIGEMNPKLTAREVKDMAITIAGTFEGLIVFVGYGRPWAKSLKAVRKYAIQSAVLLVKSGVRSGK